MRKVSRALISVSDKTAVVDLAQGLYAQGVEILSTGGTANLLRQKGLPVTDVSDYTGFPELLDGRIKTLHPRIHGGLLAQRSNPEHQQQMQEQGLEPIDMVVVNLYPFASTVAKPGCTLEEAVENIDIGGPTMLRNAAKNHQDVGVLVDPDDYAVVLDELQQHEGMLSSATRYRLATKAFAHTAAYDGAISNYLGQLEEPAAQRQTYPQTFSMQVHKAQDLRYGENPAQSAAFYVEADCQGPCVATAQQLHGKELSYNNIMDLDAAWEAVREFNQTAVVVVKHTNPCGVAVGDAPAEAYQKARGCDPVSAFGGIVAFNVAVDKAAAEILAETFLEAVIAPGYSEEAFAILSRKKNIRLMQTPMPADVRDWGFHYKRVTGGLLVQQWDHQLLPAAAGRVATSRQPSPQEMAALDFAWRVCKHVKSNAIVLATAEKTVGIGAGQMSRVDSSRLAVEKAQVSTQGTVLASDAFFPFRDGVDAAAAAGATALIQPGGSVRDDEVIAAADEQGLAMVLTGERHFRH